MRIEHGCIAVFEGDWREKTCGTCVRYTEDRQLPGSYRCTGYGMRNAKITFASPACEHYWDLEEQRRLDSDIQERKERERMKRWDANRDKPPITIRWERTFDGCRDDFTEPMPFCGNCGEPLYDTEEGRCYFCGQAFLRDLTLDEWESPPETEHMDCPHCGGEGTFEFVRAKPNGHIHGKCAKCGTVILT